MTPAQIAGVSTFYGQFRQRPVGEHIIRVCEGTACHVSGAVEVRNELCRCLGITGDADTDPSGQFTVERVACVGSCSLAPVMTIDEKIYGRLNALSAAGVLRAFVAADAGRNGNGHKGASPAPTHIATPSAGAVEIRIGVGSCGIASGALEVQAALEEELRALGGGATIKPVGCSGFCHREPLVEVVEGGKRVLYGNVSPADVRKLVREHVRPAGLVPGVRAAVGDVRARLTDDGAWSPISAQVVEASPYITKQVRIVLENCGEVDPLSLDDYRAREGFRALEACLSRPPEQVIEEIRTSGLRGRGGAGFPTAVKWDLARKAAGDTKYVIGNGDEGDPGAFMDRAVLEADPFRVIEGLTIAAYAIGASEGFLYVRREYPVAVRHVRAAIESAAAAGLLGERILGSPFSFRLQVREGAGAFVCGEETALIQSLEGQRGMPRPRPPYPAQSGYRGQPTLINNVETLACVPWIIRKGARDVRRPGDGTVEGHEGVLAGREDRARGPHRSADGHHRCARSSRRWAAASRAAGPSRPCWPAARPGAASRHRSPTPGWTTRNSRPPAPSWGRAVSWSSTTTTARWTSPATSCTSRRTSRAASARSAASARGACSRSSSGSAPGRGGPATSRPSSRSPKA